MCRLCVNPFINQNLTEYPWERYEPHYPPSYGLYSTTVLLEGWFSINNPRRLIGHKTNQPFIALSARFSFTICGST